MRICRYTKGDMHLHNLIDIACTSARNTRTFELLIKYLYSQDTGTILLYFRTNLLGFDDKVTQYMTDRAEQGFCIFKSIQGDFLIV